MHQSPPLCETPFRQFYNPTEKAMFYLNSRNSSKTDFESIQGSLTSSGLNLTKIFSKDVKQYPRKTVEVKVEFFKFGQIDTKKECFDAELLIELSWEDPSMIEQFSASSLPYDDNGQLDIRTLYNMIKSNKYDNRVRWSPNVFVTNAVTELKEEFIYKVKLACKKGALVMPIDLKSRTQLPNFDIKNLTVLVIEKRKVKGMFHQKLELSDFPFDVQELKIYLSSKNTRNDVIFKSKPVQDISSLVHVNGFRDQQQWKLFRYVRNEASDENSKYTSTVYIARYPNYYIYNIYIVIFLITTVAFVPFSFDPANPHFRGIVTGILLNIAISFRWAFNQIIPSISYLTNLDKYALTQFLFMILLLTWHALIGSDLFSTTSSEKKSIELKFLCASAVVYILFNLIFFVNSVRLFCFRRFAKGKLETLASSSFSHHEHQADEQDQIEMMKFLELEHEA